MSRKSERVNKEFQRVIGQIIHEEADKPADVLVTVARVETAANLASAEVFLSVFPTEQAEETVEHLREQLYELQGSFNRRLDARTAPRIRFTVDYGADKANSIEERLREIRDEDQPSPPGEV